MQYLTVGSHTIAIEGIGNAVATLGKVRVQKAEMLPLAVVDGETYDFDDAKFVLRNGAKLRLDYPGANICRGVTVDGVSLHGVVGAGDSASIEGPGKLDIHPRGLMLTIK